MIEILTSITNANSSHLLWTYFSKYSVWIKLFNSRNSTTQICKWNTCLAFFFFFPGSNVGFDLIYPHFKSSLPLTIVLEGL